MALGTEWSASRPCRFTPGKSVPTCPLLSLWIIGSLERFGEHLLPLPGIELRFFGCPACSGLLTQLRYIQQLCNGGDDTRYILVLPSAVMSSFAVWPFYVCSAALLPSQCGPRSNCSNTEQECMKFHELLLYPQSNRSLKS